MSRRSTSGINTVSTKYIGALLAVTFVLVGSPESVFDASKLSETFLPTHDATVKDVLDSSAQEAEGWYLATRHQYRDGEMSPKEIRKVREMVETDEIWEQRPGYESEKTSEVNRRNGISAGHYAARVQSPYEAVEEK